MPFSPVANIAIMRITPEATARLRLQFTPSVLAAIDPIVARARAAALAMPDAQFYGWDAQLGITPEAVNLSQGGSCGGGSCNDSFANTQFWNMRVACSAEVYTRVLFQWSRYVSAQARLERLLANPPQAWVRDMYFADTQDALGRSTRQPTPPGREMTFVKAPHWADWCMEVARCIAIARWATNINWCTSERTPDFYLGPRSADGKRKVKATSAFGDPAERDAAPAEIGTVACARGRDPRGLDVASTDIAFGTFPPDEAWGVFGGFHPQGYFRGTSPRGAGPSRWTFGGGDVPTRWAEANAGVNELHPSGSSDALRDLSRAALGGWYDSFDPYVPRDRANGIRYTPTIIQFSNALRLRRGMNSGAGPFTMPSSQADWDPVIAPSMMVSGGAFMWPYGIRAPRPTTVRQMLVELFFEIVDRRTMPSGAMLDKVKRCRAFQLHAMPNDWLLPTGVRQAWWLMGHAYDVVDTSFGTVVSNAFNNFLVAMNQIPEAYRTNGPMATVAAARAVQQANLDAAFAVTSAVASGIAGVGAAIVAAVPVGTVVGIVLEVVAALVLLGAVLARAAVDLGLVRMESPPILPQISIRSAGVVEDPTDACWLTTPQRSGGGGAAALVPKATAIRDVARTTEDPAAWYAHVQRAIAAGTQAPPTTTPTVNKGVALAGGTIAGIALVKLLGG